MYGADNSPYTVLRSWLYRRPIPTVISFFVINIMVGGFVLLVFDQPMSKVMPKKRDSLKYLDEVWQAVTVMTTSRPQ